MPFPERWHTCTVTAQVWEQCEIISIGVHSLFGNLEFARINYPAIAVTELENVDASVKIAQIYDCFGGYIGDLKNFPAQETEYLEGIGSVIIFLKVEINNGSGGIGVKFNHPGRSISSRR